MRLQPHHPDHQWPDQRRKHPEHRNVIGDADGDHYPDERTYGMGSHWLDDVADYLKDQKLNKLALPPTPCSLSRTTTAWLTTRPRTAVAPSTTSSTRRSYRGPYRSAGQYRQGNQYRFRRPGGPHQPREPHLFRPSRLSRFFLSQVQPGLVRQSEEVRDQCQQPDRGAPKRPDRRLSRRLRTPNVSTTISRTATSS